MRRIGIFAGAFDPVHDGHITFALAAIKPARLDKIYFLVEAKPRYKPDITHFAHRQAMLKLATSQHSQLAVMELPDRQFSVSKTLPRLNQKFPDDQLFLIIGSDLLESIGDWPLVDRLLSRMGLIAGLRSGFTAQRAKNLVKKLPTVNQTLVIISPAAELSSAEIRQALLNGKKATGLDPEVKAYVKANWLYSSPSNSSSAS